MFGLGVKRCKIKKSSLYNKAIIRYCHKRGNSWAPPAAPGRETERLQISLSAVTVRSHSFVMSCHMGLPLPKVSYDCGYSCKHGSTDHSYKRHEKTRPGLKHEGGGRVEKGLSFSEWMAEKSEERGPDHVLACSVCGLCVSEQRGEAERDRKGNVIYL